MNRKTKLLGLIAAAALSAAPITSANAYGWHHYHHDPVFGLVRAAVTVATLPVRVAGGIVAATVPPYPVYARPVYARPVYYSAPVAYYPQPVYSYAQPVYGYPAQ